MPGRPGAGLALMARSSGPWPVPVLAGALAAAALLLALLGLAAGSEGWSLAGLAGRADGPEREIVAAIRMPRTLGAMLCGALLGMAGAIAQGLFRNPLADPYLLGTAAGASLGVVAVIAAGSAFGTLLGGAAAGWLQRLGLVTAAFGGAMGGLLLTLALARGTGRPMVLLLAGVVVGILLSALAELILLVAPEALRGRQVFMLGTTGYLGWSAVGILAAALAAVLPAALRCARVMDALVLGESSALSLGLALPRLRLLLVALMALATATAVAQAGLVAFVGLVAPHLVRRLAVTTHGPLIALSALAGAVLLLGADIAARSVIAPQELPVGVLTAVFGGGFLLVLLRQRSAG